MGLPDLIYSIGNFGRDIRLNLTSVLSEEGAPGLSRAQIWGTALACAYATKARSLIEAIEAASAEHLNEAVRDSAKSAATIMAMNNVYYRFTHLMEDKVFTTMPARLRMSVIGKPGIEKTDFELMCLAVSALSGCGACMNAHVREARKAGVSDEGSQSAVRIASVLNAAAQAVSI
jgi:lipoyl-dependent peroxiredoxin subunit D